MATDFNYNNKTIVSSGPFKPSGKDMPVDARARVEAYADIASIPNPYIGLRITVKVDETNNNKMTDYIVKSLKANSMGAANSAVDEVVRYVDYLGVSSSGGGTGSSGNVDLTGYATETFVNNSITEALDGHTFKFLTQAEYDDLEVKDPLVEYHITDATESGEGLTSEQAQQLQTAYEHSQSNHVSMDEVNQAIANAQLSGGSVDLSAYATKAYADNAVSTAIGEIGTILDSVNGEVI